MISPTPGELHVSWQEYHDAIEQLALLVHESGWGFDQVLCLARGGLIPGDLFSRIFQVPLAILSTSSYRGEQGRTQGHLDIARHVTTLHAGLSGRVLLIDDLIDTGTTIAGVQQHLSRSFPEVSEVRSAVLWCKRSARIRPDYCRFWLEGDPWIHQPFERYDNLRPERIVKRIDSVESSSKF